MSLSNGFRLIKENLEEINGELLDQDITVVQLDELKNFLIYKQVEDVEGDKTTAQLVAKGFGKYKEVPSDSPTVDGVSHCVTFTAL